MTPPREYIHPSLEEMSLPRILHALSDPIRLEMVRRLAEAGESDSLDLAEGIPRSTLTYHTRILRENGVTHTRSEGRACLISLRRAELEQACPGLLDAVIRAPRPDDDASDSASS